MVDISGTQPCAPAGMKLIYQTLVGMGAMAWEKPPPLAVVVYFLPIGLCFLMI
jgi:hypothetical protein